MAALGAATRQYGCSALGLHTCAKAVNFRAMAAVRLKRALRHGTALLNFSLENAARQTQMENATSRQRLSISYSRCSRKTPACEPLFHNLWCNLLPSKKMTQKPHSLGILTVLVSATISREFP